MNMRIFGIYRENSPGEPLTSVDPTAYCVQSHYVYYMSALDTTAEWLFRDWSEWLFRAPQLHGIFYRHSIICNTVTEYLSLCAKYCSDCSCVFPVSTFFFRARYGVQTVLVFSAAEYS